MNILIVGAGEFIGAALRYMIGIAFLYAFLSLIIGCGVIFGIEMVMSK